MTLNGGAIAATGYEVSLGPIPRIPGRTHQHAGDRQLGGDFTVAPAPRRS